MSRAAPHAGSLGRSMPRDHALLQCVARGHEHYCGDIQVERILQGPCPWDGSPLYLSAWWDGDALVSAEPREED